MLYKKGSVFVNVSKMSNFELSEFVLIIFLDVVITVLTEITFLGTKIWKNCILLTFVRTLKIKFTFANFKNLKTNIINIM